MKKTILLSLVVTSLVMGANTVDGLTIDQKNEITSSSKIDNATVHQGKTEVLGASDVDDVTIVQGSTTTTGNLIENSDISRTAEDGKETTISQGYVKVNSSTATKLELTAQNTIKNIEITNTSIRQGNFIIEGGSTVKDTLSSGTDELSSISIIENSIADGTDIDSSEIEQGHTELLTGSTVDKLKLFNQNELKISTTDNSKIYQSKLKVDDSEVSVIEIGSSKTNNHIPYNLNSIENSNIEGESVVRQSDIRIEKGSNVNTLVSEAINIIVNFSAEKSLISQNTISIDSSDVTNFKTTQDNTIEGATVENDTYTTWASANDITKPTTISQGETTIN